MSSKNPFGNLTIRRDEDEEEVTQTKTGASTTVQQPLFTQNNTQKKKKVRPEEKKKHDEHHQEEDTEEGFSVVKKNSKPIKPRVQQDRDENAPKEKVKEHHLKNKGAYNDRNTKVPQGKRLFDKQSGTGRGKEIAKNGQGGKHTWGGDGRRNRDEEYNGDEDCKFLLKFFFTFLTFLKRVLIFTLFSKKLNYKKIPTIFTLNTKQFCYCLYCFLFINFIKFKTFYLFF